jgi:hypothetical protein
VNRSRLICQNRRIIEEKFSLHTGNLTPGV